MTDLDLFAYAADIQEERPGAVGRNNPDTSRQAALNIRTGTQRWQALHALRAAGEHGLTAFEAADRLGHRRPHVIGTRIIELREGDLVAKNGETRPTDTGHQAEVYVITDLGRRVLEAGEA